MAKKKTANVIVRAKECRGNHERMIKRFIKKTKKEIEATEFNNRQQKELKNQMESMADPFKFVEQKNSY